MRWARVGSDLACPWCTHRKGLVKAVSPGVSHGELIRSRTPFSKSHDTTVLSNSERDSPTAALSLPLALLYGRPCGHLLVLWPTPLALFDPISVYGPCCIGQSSSQLMTHTAPFNPTTIL